MDFWKTIIIIGGIVLAFGLIVVIPEYAIYLAIAAVVLVFAFVAILKRPWVGILLVAFFLPFERIGGFDVVGMTTIRISQVFAVATLIAWILHGLVSGKFKFRRYPLLWPSIIFILICLLSLTQAQNLERGFTVLIFTVFVMIVAYLVPQLIYDEKKYRRIIFTILISATIVSLFGLFQFAGDVIGLPATVTGLREHYTGMVFGFPRVQSTALEPLYFANYLLIPIAIAIMLYVGKGYKGLTSGKLNWIEKLLMKKWVQIGLVLLFLVNLLLTLSRGGYLGLFVLAVMLAVLGARYILKPKYVIVLLVILAIGFGAMQYIISSTGTLSWGTFIGQATNLSEGASIEERYETYEIAEKAFESSPLLGVGIGNFGPYAAFDPFHMDREEGWLIVNNETLELLAEVGILGLAAFLLIVIVVIVRSAIAIAKCKNEFQKLIMIALLAAFIAILAQYQTFSTLYIMHFWFLIGLIVAGQNLVLIRNSELKIKN